MPHSNLEHLHEIKRHDGSVGYQGYLKSVARHTIPSSTHITTSTNDSFGNSSPATGVIWSVILYTRIVIDIGTHSGRGTVWGVGMGLASFDGLLAYESLEELTSGENTIQMFYLGLGAEGTLVQFFVNDKQVAYMDAFGRGLGVLVGLTGTLTWS